MKKETKKEAAERAAKEYEIKNGNLLIAIKLMGGHLNPEGKLYNVYLRQRHNGPDSIGYYRPESLKYHTDYSWIIPVIVSLKEADLSIFDYDAIRLSQFRSKIEHITNLPIVTPIQILWQELLDLAKWYDAKTEQKLFTK